MATERQHADASGSEMHFSVLAQSREKIAALQLSLNAARRDARFMAEECECVNRSAAALIERRDALFMAEECQCIHCSAVALIERRDALFMAEE